MNTNYTQKLEAALKATGRLGAAGLVGAVLAATPVRAETNTVDSLDAAVETYGTADVAAETYDTADVVPITAIKEVVEDGEKRMRISFPTEGGVQYALAYLDFVKNESGTYDSVLTPVLDKNGVQTIIYGNDGVRRVDASLNDRARNYAVVRLSGD